MWWVGTPIFEDFGASERAKAQMTMKSTIEQFDEVMERLVSQRAPAIQYVAFLRDLADNDDRWEKYRDSFSGHVINLQIVTVENALILLCRRIWDEGTDVQSIKRANGLLRRCEPEVTVRRRQDIDAEMVEGWEEKRHDALQEISKQYSTLSKDSVHDVLIVLRNENLAHLLPSSEARKKRFPNGFEGHGVTRHDLHDFAEKSIKLIENIEHYRTGHVYDFDESLRVFKDYCESYWNAVPTFREAES